jgi:hypothetical protein
VIQHAPGNRALKGVRLAGNGAVEYQKCSVGNAASGRDFAFQTVCRSAVSRIGGRLGQGGKLYRASGLRLALLRHVGTADQAPYAAVVEIAFTLAS